MASNAMPRETLWQAMKNEAQNAFIGISQAYQDILVHGRLMVHGNMDRRNALNMEIAEDAYGLSETRSHEIGHKPSDAEQKPPETDIEPER